MKKILLFFFIWVDLFSQTQLVNFVNPFVGTAGHGHTFPGASLPFGMVQLSPDTDIQGWDWCSGYNFSDSSIVGFSHTHLSGTGAGDYGDILFMPYNGKHYFTSGSKDGKEKGYRSSFSHTTEIASPGYYSVELDKHKIKVELSATERCGFHRYNFSKRKEKHILIDLQHGTQDQSIDTYLKLIDSRTIVGYRRSSGWAKDHTVFFYATFNLQIDSCIIQNENVFLENEAKGKGLKAVLIFNDDIHDKIEVKVGISSTGINGAKSNLENEIGNKNFEKVKKLAVSKWEKELSRIKVYSKNIERLKVFYTSLYHSFLSPNIQSDFDGKYFGMDSLIHDAKNNHEYTVFSLWDTFRALHPLINLLDSSRATGFAISLLNKQSQSGLLPVWELASNETGTMIGYHAVPVIAEMIMKNFSGFDYNSAYEAMKKSSMQNMLGVNYLKKLGFVPMDREDDAVSRTLEYSFDDWCIAQVAKKFGFGKDYEYYIQRSQNYKNVFDKNSGFMRGRNYDGTWKIKFDPGEPFPLGAGEFTEGSSWQYSWFVPQDISGLISLIGGEKKFEQKLDCFFDSRAEGNYYMPADVTGLIGQYAHGNEPSHHIAYLYNYIGAASKSQKIVNKILLEMYSDKNDGLIGNEDCGQMSAWYVFSSLGFYPVNPVSNQYVIGSPIFDSANVELHNGRDLKLFFNRKSEDDIYVQSISINGKISKQDFISYDELMNSSRIEFELGDSSTDFGIAIEDRPESKITEPFIPSEELNLFQPAISTNQTIFRDSIIIGLKCISIDAEIFYSIDNQSEQKYIEPILISNSCLLKFYSRKNEVKSEAKEVHFIKGLIPEKNHDFPKIEFANPFSDMYSGTGKNNLIDGIRASNNFRDGFWQGFYGKNLECVIDLGMTEKLGGVTIGLLQNQGSWIFLPRNLKLFSSNDNVNYTMEESIEIDDAKMDYKIQKKDFTLNSHGAYRYYKIIAETIGNCPSWHNGNGYPSWIFADEIILVKDN